jgi:predicted DNA-binding protein
MLAIRLDKEIEERLANLASRTGRTKTFYARQAILAYLGELEDRHASVEGREPLCVPSGDASKRPSQARASGLIRRTRNDWQRSKPFVSPSRIYPMLTGHFLKFLGLLERHKAEYVVVGGYAMAVHGFPRFAGDLDIFVAISRENAGRLLDAFGDLGFASLNLGPEDFLEPDMAVEIGCEPTKIRVLTGIDGISFDRCRDDLILVNVSGTPIPFIGLDSLLASKAASPRNRDLMDFEELTRLRDLQKDRDPGREIG